MLVTNFTAREQDEYLRTLVDDHSVKVTIRVTNLMHHGLTDISDKFLEGQIDFDLSKEESDRSGKVKLFDPEDTLELAPLNSEGYGKSLSKLIRVFYGVKGPRSLRWFEVPLMTGVIVSTKRTGHVVEVELQGKEVLAKRAIHGARTWAKGTLRRQVIVDTMKMVGENPSLVDVVNIPDRLASPLTLAKEEDAWAFLKTVTRGFSAPCHLYYDGRGVCRLVKITDTVPWRFRDGEGGSLITTPEATVDTLTNLVNRVVVTGQAANEKTAAPTGTAVAPKTFPYSPMNIQRNGVGMGFTERVDDSGVTTSAVANEKAATILNQKLARNILSASFQALPVPHLELRDKCRIQTEEGLGTYFYVTQMSIPLGVGAMTMGGTRPVTRPKSYLAKVPRAPIPKRKKK